MSGHSWAKHEREGWTVCTVCGAVRNYDRPASSCRGAARITLREATGGEQGETAEMIEIAKLRGELDRLGADRHDADTATIDRISAALWNLIDSVTATKTRDTIVLRDLEAARAVLEDRP